MTGSQLMIYRRKAGDVTQDALAERLGIYVHSVRDVELDRLVIGEAQELAWVEAIDEIAAANRAAADAVPVAA